MPLATGGASWHVPFVPVAAVEGGNHAVPALWNEML